MTEQRKPTQQARILAVLESVRDHTHNIPDEYIRHHKSGNGISARYFKQVLLVSECNGRISELRSKGYDIETSKEKDRWGFAFHRLAPEPSNLTLPEILAAAREAVAQFDRL